MAIKPVLKKAKKHLYPKSKWVVITRKGGGSLIESTPVFSDDSKYIYVNSLWSLKVFSLKTRECAKTLEVHPDQGKIVSVFSHSGFPSTLTSKLKYFIWNPKSGKFNRRLTLKFPPYDIAEYGFLVPSLSDKCSKDLCVIASSDTSKTRMLGFFSTTTGELLNHPLNNTPISKTNAMKYSISSGGPPNLKFLAVMEKRECKAYSLNGTRISTSLKPGSKLRWTCVECHPLEPAVALGDSLGRVIFYPDVFNRPSAHSSYHWHTLPCPVITFTPAGSSMYTGGGEHVLVKWNTQNQRVRNFLPRLSAPIVHISVSSDNNLVAVSTLDNCLIIVDSSNKVQCKLQGMAWGVMPPSNQMSSCNLFPAGLTVDPRTSSVVLNSRSGHLQFYKPSTESIVYQVDVTQLNYLTQERDKLIVNTEVTHCVISPDSSWLATVETRSEPPLTLELKLKLWQYFLSAQRWGLNTCVDAPHSAPVTCIRFRPGPTELPLEDKPVSEHLLVTAGLDSNFRLWSPSPIDSIYRKGVSWGCEAVGSFKDKEGCGPAGFSQDGSILGVIFKNTITIWTLAPLALKTTLTRFNHPVRLLEFGRDRCCHLVVGCSSRELVVWDLVSLSALWMTQVQAEILVADPLSSHMALFSESNKVYVFSPDRSEPLYEGKVEEGRAVCATWVPRSNVLPSATSWLQTSVLYFLDSNQELKCFESKKEEGNLQAVAEDATETSALSLLLTTGTRSEVETSASKDPRSLQYGILGDKPIKQFLNIPCHTMPPLSLLCDSLMESFALKKKSIQEVEMEKRREEMEDDEVEAEEAESEEDSEEEGSSNQPLIVPPAIFDFKIDPVDKNSKGDHLKPEGNDIFFIDVDEKMNNDLIENFSFK